MKIAKPKGHATARNSANLVHVSQADLTLASHDEPNGLGRIAWNLDDLESVPSKQSLTRVNKLLWALV